MTHQELCQSCGMPVAKGFYGSTADGSETREYCRFCYQQGRFTEPELTLRDMIARSVDYMVASLRFEPQEAEKISREVIPTLGRWQ